MRARKLGRRAVRWQTGQFLAEGPQAVREALRAGLAVELFVTPDGQDRHRDLVAAALDGDCQVIDVDERTLAGLADTVNPQGLVAVATMPVASGAEALNEQTKLVAVLVEARDPGNVGTIIRIADAAGADAVILTSGSVDPYNSKSVRSSAGSVFHLPVLTGWSVDEVGARLGDLNITALGAAGDAAIDLTDLTELTDLADRGAGPSLQAPTAWFFGNEAHGLDERAKASCQQLVRIPIFGQAESLNIGAAVAVCLYASAIAQRRTVSPNG